MRDMSNSDYQLKYEQHFRGLEELFNVNIVLFGFSGEKSSPYGIKVEFELIIPRHRIAHFKTYYENRPTIILIQSKQHDNYNLIIADNQRIFPHQSKHMFNFFASTHVSITAGPDYLVENMYSRTNWQEFFKGFVVEQEIDSYGKMRAIKLDNGTTLSIPPSQPLNLPRITQYEKISESTCIGIFGEPNAVDNDGFWYSWLDFENMIYVLCEHDREKTPNLKVFMNSPFRGTSNILDDVNNTSKQFKSCNALVQIIHWAWRLDKRTNINSWLSKYLTSSNRYDKNTILPENILVGLPSNIRTSEQAFAWASTWWPQVFRNNRVNVYEDLYNKLIGFFRREAEIMEGNVRDDIPPMIFKIYDKPSDYPPVNNKIVFTDSTSLQEFITKSIVNDVIHYDMVPLEQRFYVKTSAPIRIYQHGRVFNIQHTTSGTLEDALKICHYWNKYKVNIGDTLLHKVTENIQSDDIAVYTVSKNNRIILYARPNNEIKYHVLLTPYDKYSAILLN